MYESYVSSKSILSVTNVTHFNRCSLIRYGTVFRGRANNNKTIRELASQDGWVESDPTQVNSWFEGIVQDRNKETEGWGTQFRHLVQLIKRFCRSRKDWLDLLPNGMKLTMLVAEIQPDYSTRIDKAFRELLLNIKKRLEKSKIICNLAHPDEPIITRTSSDSNVTELLGKITEASAKINELDDDQSQNLESARRIWDWIFKSDTYFKDYDESSSEWTISEDRCRSPFAVAWRETPPWPIKENYSVSLSGKYGSSEHGTTWCPFQSDGTPLNRRL